MTPGIFITGTDTGIGKTYVAACLARRWGAAYWKPVQTGLAQDEPDSQVVARLAGARVHPPRFELQAPLSPEAAGKLEGVTVRLEDFELPREDGPLVVEGAGGALVPLGAGRVMADLMVRLALPVLVVARSTLGTINHTLLTLEALRARRLAVWGVVMVGDGGQDNAEAIGRLGGAAVLARLPRLAEVTPVTVAAASLALPGLNDMQAGTRA